MKPLFDRYRGERPVYALDLPGYGFSNRARRHYTPELFADAILEFLATQVSEPADVVALSLSSEFVARAAFKAPERFKSLTFISPTGMNTKREARSSDKAGKEGGNDTFYSVASNPLWARAFYDLIATPASIHYFLQQSFVGAVPPDLAAYAYLTSHQPGAEHVPLYFISGKLFTPAGARTALRPPEGAHAGPVRRGWVCEFPKTAHTARHKQKRPRCAARAFPRPTPVRAAGAHGGGVEPFLAGC